MRELPLRARALRPEDIPAVVGLFGAVFGKEITPEHYRWKLRTRPSPVENVTIAVDEQDRPVFHSAGIPCRCRIGGAERWVMIGVDVMTAARYRRRGLHTTHSNVLYQRWRDAGVAAVIGFTNERWGTTVSKVGLRPLLPLASLVFPLRPERMLARKTGLWSLARFDGVGRIWRSLMLRPPRRAAGVQIEEVRVAGEELDRLWVDASRDLKNSLVRDRDWVRWRYLESPGISYRVLLMRRGGVPVGYAAVRGCEHDTATIAEVFTRPGDRDAFQMLLRSTVTLALDGCAESIRTLAVPGSWLYLAFRRAGFLRSGTGVIQYIPLDPALTPRAMGAASDWYVTAGDFDAV
ncbi:MAG: GNAT family N-acetyltransferase [Gemmatimonadetes bacterium]|nr:GNAT family N-acetyltransferase [Gemmatimonadota bacterium]